MSHLERRRCSNTAGSGSRSRTEPKQERQPQLRGVKGAETRLRSLHGAVATCCEEDMASSPRPAVPPKERLSCRHCLCGQDWAIEVASENDRRLTSFGPGGGGPSCELLLAAVICFLSCARLHSARLGRRSPALFVQRLSASGRARGPGEGTKTGMRGAGVGSQTGWKDLIDSGTCTEDDAAVQCIRTLAPWRQTMAHVFAECAPPQAKATEEREALMRRLATCSGRKLSLGKAW